MFDSIKANAEVYTSAAELGVSGLYFSGEVTKFGGFLFIEEAGANAVTEYGTNAKSCVFGQNALAGWDNFINGETVKFYMDDDNDFGRKGKIGWKGLFGASLTVDAAANARSWVVYSSY